MSPEKPPKSTKKTRKFPSPDMSSGTFVKMDSTQWITSILGVETDLWRLENIQTGFEDGVKVSRFFLRYIGPPNTCFDCGVSCALHEENDHVWRHSDLNDTVCYIHTDVPKYICPKCGKISQLKISWANPKSNYTKRFMETH